VEAGGCRIAPFPFWAAGASTVIAVGGGEVGPPWEMGRGELAVPGELGEGADSSDVMTTTSRFMPCTQCPGMPHMK